MDFGAAPDDEERRQELEELASERGTMYMHAYLQGLDPEAASRIHPNNTRKIIRAIEAYEHGKGIKDLTECEINTDYDFKFYALTMEREWLYERINRRVSRLISEGLVDEVSGLLIMGICGGAVFPMLMGAASDTVGSQAGAIAVVSVGVLYLLGYWLAGLRKKQD